MTRVIITGAKGRMGQALIDCAARFPDLQVTGKIDLGDDIKSVIDNSDAVIDFSFHNATAAIARGKALVIGTTGHSDQERAEVVGLANKVPIVWASNYSTGVNALFWLTRKAAEILGPDFDLEVIEMHHRMKKDAPSGTAATLGEILAEVRGLQVKEALRHGRHGIVVRSIRWHTPTERAAHGTEILVAGPRPSVASRGWTQRASTRDPAP